MKSKIKFSVFCPTIGVEYKELLTKVREAERLGYYSAMFPDHFLSALVGENRVLECWTTIASLTAHTSSIHLGSLVTCISFRSPSLLAKMSSTIDVISKGRLILGIGAGFFKAEYLAYGFPFPAMKIRVEQLREAVLLIKTMWKDNKPSFKRKYYSIDGATNFPKPVQKPHPPIIIGGSEERHLLRVTAELADCCNFGWNQTVEEYNHKLSVLKKLCQIVGRDPKQIEKSFGAYTIVQSNMAELKRKLKKIKKLYRASRKTLEFMNRGIIATYDQCVDRLTQYIELGVTHFILLFPEPDSLVNFARNVIPQLENVGTQR